MNTALKVIDDICVGNKHLNREKLLRYESFAKELPQVEIPVKHYIHGGMYAREITIPKGIVLTGQIYKFDHFDIMISGDITVSTDTGETKRLTGYNLFEGLSGKKRAGYAHEDTTWVTFHPFTGKNGDSIQDFITAKTFEDLQEFNTVINKADYVSMVSDMNTSEEEIKSQSENELDQVKMPVGYEYVYTFKSEINGNGLFSKILINTGEMICPSRINGKRTPAGRYTNHALLCNAEMIVDNGDIYLFATRPIESNEEITINYRTLMKQRLIKGDLCQE